MGFRPLVWKATILTADGGRCLVGRDWRVGFNGGRVCLLMAEVRKAESCVGGNGSFARARWAGANVLVCLSIEGLSIFAISPTQDVPDNGPRTWAW